MKRRCLVTPLLPIGLIQPRCIVGPLLSPNQWHQAPSLRAEWVLVPPSKGGGRGTRGRGVQTGRLSQRGEKVLWEKRHRKFCCVSECSVKINWAELLNSLHVRIKSVNICPAFPKCIGKQAITHQSSYISKIPNISPNASTTLPTTWPPWVTPGTLTTRGILAASEA